MGPRSDSRLARLVGLLAFAVGVVGFVVFGWEFGGATNSVVSLLGVVAAFVAVLFVFRG